MALRIELPQEAIADFCRRWCIRELAIFGSALRDDFRPDSDVDVLVTFEPGIRWGFHHQLEMTRELESFSGAGWTWSNKAVTTCGVNIY